LAQSAGGGSRSGGGVSSIPHFIRVDFAHATQTILYLMAAIMLAAAVVARVGLERGLQTETADEPVGPAEPAGATAG
jgi:hypothetical protein